MTVKRVSSLPKSPKKGVVYERLTRSQNGDRLVGFVYTGSDGFGKFKIVYNKGA